MSARVAAHILNTALRAPPQRSAFPTITARYQARPVKKANSNRPDDIEIPAFDVKHITSSPRARFWLVSFCVLASVEGYGWYNFGPKILGWEKVEDEE